MFQEHLPQSVDAEFIVLVLNAPFDLRMLFWMTDKICRNDASASYPDMVSIEKFCDG